MPNSNDPYFESKKERDQREKEYREFKKRMNDSLNKQLNNWEPRSTTVPNDTPFHEVVRKIALEAVEVLIKKHHDYGPDNINNAPGGALNGLLVRMHDKMERLKTLVLGNKTPRYESVEDTLIDLINYSIIALMVQRGKWPK